MKANKKETEKRYIPMIIIIDQKYRMDVEMQKSINDFLDDLRSEKIINENLYVAIISNEIEPSIIQSWCYLKDIHELCIGNDNLTKGFDMFMSEYRRIIDTCTCSSTQIIAISGTDNNIPCISRFDSETSVVYIINRSSNIQIKSFGKERIELWPYNSTLSDGLHKISDFLFFIAHGLGDFFPRTSRCIGEHVHIDDGITINGGLRKVSLEEWLDD